MKKHLLESIPLPGENVQWREFGADAIVVDPRTGDYAQINETGVLIWKSIDGQSSIREIITRLASEFETPAEDLQDDVTGFVEELMQKRLLTVRR